MNTKYIYQPLKAFGTILAALALTMAFPGCSQQFDLDEDPGVSQLAVLPYDTQAELEWCHEQ